MRKGNRSLSLQDIEIQWVMSDCIIKLEQDSTEATLASNSYNDAGGREVVDGSVGEVIQDKVLKETGIEKDAKALVEKLKIGMEGYFLAF